MADIIALYKTFLGKIIDRKCLSSVGLLPATLDKKEFTAEPISNQEFVEVIEEVRKRLVKQPSGSGANLILGSADFLPFEFLNKGSTAGESVCCLVKKYNQTELENIIEQAQKIDWIRGEAMKWFVDSNISLDLTKEADRSEFKRQATDKRVPCGTGFLVGERYLLTNLHVVEDLNQLSQFYAAFNYENDLKEANLYSFDSSFWKQDETLDYVLLRLQLQDGQRVGKEIALGTVGSVQVVPYQSPQDIESWHTAGELSKDEYDRLKENGFPGDVVNIIQHPEGRPKEIAIFNNQLKRLDRDFLVYTTDTQPGSSGSPLFNAQWELIGLHQAALLDGETGKVTSYLGIRMSSILADLQNKAKADPEVKAFLDEVFRSTSPSTSTTKKQVFMLAGRDRSKVLPKEFAALEQKAMLKLQAQVKQALNLLDSSIKVQLIDGSGKDLESAIDNINLKAAESADTQSAAIELLTDEYCDPKVGGISAYYYSGNPRRKDDTNAFLNPIREKGIPLFGIGAYSEAVTRAGRLEFCRRTTMPALVFYAGYLSNPKDRARIEALGTEISPLAEGMAAGLLAWLQRIH